MNKMTFQIFQQSQCHQNFANTNPAIYILDRKNKTKQKKTKTKTKRKIEKYQIFKAGRQQ